MGLQHLSPERRRAIQKKGGEKGGHRFTSEEARLAGQRGGRMAPTAAKSAAGRKGGLAKAKTKTKKEA